MSSPGQATRSKECAPRKLKRQPLDVLFEPRSVAVIGADEAPGSVGRQILRNLLSSPFGGIFFPVNPRHSNVLGIQSYATIKEIPQRVELAIVALPAPLVPNAISECVSAGVQVAVIISAGFRETGAQGLELEMEIKERVKGSRMRILGPNCMGVMNPVGGLNATCAASAARSGNVALISESGALCRAILDWSLREMVGFSALVSVGSMLDISWGDLIDYFADQPRTQSIVCYMQSIGNARAFLSAAREVSLSKPIIVIKAGRSGSAAKAAECHTGALSGSDEAVEAAFRRCGVLRVNEIDDVFYMAEVLAKQPRPPGNRLLIVTNAGGAGVLCTDALIAAGGALAELAPDTSAALDTFLPRHWSNGNPVDILDDADGERTAKTLQVVTKDPNHDGLLMVIAPQDHSSTAIARSLEPYAKSTGRPVLASFIGGAEVGEANEILKSAGIPTFPFPGAAARAFTYMWRYSYNLRGLYETASIREAADPDRKAAEELVRRVRAAGRTLLTEVESKQLLASYRIPISPTKSVVTEDEAVLAAEEIGFPVVVKLLSEAISHKTEVGGVQLWLRDAQSVRQAFRGIRDNLAKKAEVGKFEGVTVQPMITNAGGYELIVGCSLDPQFGPILLFGSGGRLVEIYRDRALALPPLNTTLARRMMEQTKIYSVLKGFRGSPAVDLQALEQLLVRFSQLVVEQPWIKEIEINPLLVSPDQLMAVDARVVVHGPGVEEEKLPRSAIRPYPIQYVSPWELKNGTPVIIRPIRPEDEQMLICFHKNLSDRSVYLRYFQFLKLSQRVTHERLMRMCFVDYDREMALVAVRKEAGGAEEIIALGQLTKLHGVSEAECAFLVCDRFQHNGLGSELCRRLLAIARAEGVQRVVSTILAENTIMREICKRVGFSLELDSDGETVSATATP
jgi:acetyltransferase